MSKKTTKQEEELKKTLSGRLQLERMAAKPNRKEFRRAVRILLEAIEKRVIDQTFRFEVQGCIDDTIAKVEGQLNPQIPFDHKVLTDALEKLPKELSEVGDEALSSLTGSLHEIYFRAGVMMGARSRGASKDDLRRMGERWFQIVGSA